MLHYVLRRLGQSVLTIAGVMLITFFLFRVIAGDIAAANLGERAPEQQKAAWRHRYGYDTPTWINLHRRLVLADKTDGNRPFDARDAEGGALADALALVVENTGGLEGDSTPAAAKRRVRSLVGRYTFDLGPDTPLEQLTGGRPIVKPAPTAASQPSARPAVQTPPPAGPQMVLLLSDGSKLAVPVDANLTTCGDLMRRINEHPANGARVAASITDPPWTEVFQSQFFRHFVTSATFQAASLKDKRKLTDIIAERAPASLSITVPAMALEFMIGLAIACFVAYSRGGTADKVGVFLSVLGMCVPFLAFMIYGQWALFELAPRHAYGLSSRANVYLPIAILVVASLGGMVRFYRTVILDETGRDYVRTAKAKGLPLPTILFKHVLRNCMLPILTSLVLSIPFLIMGSLLVEGYFGIPGLGDLMLTSIRDRNEPIMNGMVFLTALVYTIGILVTDICYAIFDPRIRLR